MSDKSDFAVYERSKEDDVYRHSGKSRLLQLSCRNLPKLTIVNKESTKLHLLTRKRWFPYIVVTIMMLDAMQVLHSLRTRMLIWIRATTGSRACFPGDAPPNVYQRARVCVRAHASTPHTHTQTHTWHIPEYYKLPTYFNITFYGLPKYILLYLNWLAIITRLFCLGVAKLHLPADLQFQIFSHFV